MFLFYISLPSLRLTPEQSVQLWCPCPTDKPLTLSWTLGSSTTVIASSSTVTQWPPHPDSWVIQCTSPTHLNSFFFKLIWDPNRRRSAEEKMTENELRRAEWPQVTPVGHLHRGPHLVYSQHWLFTRSRRHTTSFKWLMHLVTSAAWIARAVDHIQRPLCDPHTNSLIEHGEPCLHVVAAKECISIRRRATKWKDNMTEKACGADFKTLLSPALRDTYQKRYFRVSLYLLWVEGEGVSISWQSMSGESEKINDIIALTTRFSYLNWQHQLKLFHSFLQWYI